VRHILAGAAMADIRPIVLIPWQAALANPDLVLPPLFDVGRKFPIISLPAMPAAQALNMAATWMLETEEGRSKTHLANLDQDHVHPADVVERLCRNIARFPEIKIIGGVNFQRPEPHKPCIWRAPGVEYGEGPAAHIDEIGYIGFGCTVVSREVFEQVEPPWFMYDYSAMKAGDSFQYPGPDIYFCKKDLAAGFKLYCDHSVTSPHIAYKLVDRASWKGNQNDDD